MKKYLLMSVAIMLLALPVKAMSLEDQLCEDEVFIALVTETIDEVVCMKELGANYKTTDDFARLNKKLTEQLAYLQSTYKIHRDPNLQATLVAAAGKALQSKKKGSPAARVKPGDGDCLLMAMLGFETCDRMFPLPGRDIPGWSACVAAVWLAVDNCLGMPQA